MIKVGVTEAHGIAKEYMKTPPEGIEYSQVKPNGALMKYIFKSHAKGVYHYVNSPEHDIIEAPIFPVITNQNWIYTPAHFASAGAFNFFGIPTPRFIKMFFAEKYLARDNLKRLILKSQFGLRSLETYGKITSPEILAKAEVIYPVVRRVSDDLIHYQNDKINILFVGEFIGKGGMNVVDAFLKLRKKYTHLKLTLASSENFHTSDLELKNTYLKKIKECPDIEMKFQPRDFLLSHVYPSSDIYISPTYREAWGFSIEEAMSFGRPIISTNINAIPEMITHGKNGFLLDVQNHPYIKGFKGFDVVNPPKDLMDFMTDEIFKQLDKMISDFEYRKALGKAALETARTKFNPEIRNKRMKEIYSEALI
ncbi:glycosyltransferase [Alishewanella sp. HL-SH06]|uniref:glycosyltransferase n=1 Tax=Alishewanella sp. HL-SH06 TaxID=3461144 RepID=UPI004040F4D5